MEDQRHDIILTSIEMAMTIVPVVTMGWASVTRSARFSPFIPMTLLPFLFQPRVNFPDSSELTNGGAWT